MLFRSIESISAGTGTGYSKKESQQNAAKMALKKLKVDDAFKEEIQAAKEQNQATEEMPKEEVSAVEVSTEADSHSTPLDD